MDKINLKDLTLEELQDYIINLGEPKFRALQIYKWIYSGVRNFEEMTNISKTLRDKLKSNTTIGNLAINKKFISTLDGTRRY